MMLSVALSSRCYAPSWRPLEDVRMMDIESMMERMIERERERSERSSSWRSR